MADLRKLLAEWRYDAEDNVRLLDGDDGRRIMQVRTQLGFEQYELEGRPDGLRPEKKESWLECRREEASRVEASGKEFHLSSEQCHQLFNEGILYYHRYLHLFQVQEWDLVVRDTARNLRLFDFVRRYATDEDDRQYLEKWRPYLLRMNAVAKAMRELERGRHNAALAVLKRAIRTVEALEELEEETFQFERRRSLMALREVEQQIQQTRPLSRIEQLERDLRRAVETEEFERAAKLRDKIKALRDVETQ